jgi:hypothetical protein
MLNPSKYTLAADGQVMGTRLTSYTKLLQQNALALSDGSYWKVSPYQPRGEAGQWEETGRYWFIVRYTETVYIHPADFHSAKARILLAYDREWNWDPMDEANNIIDDNPNDIVMKNETAKIIKLQRLFKTILYRTKGFPAFSMVTHPRLGAGNSMGSLLTDDVMRVIASQLFTKQKMGLFTLKKIAFSMITHHRLGANNSMGSLLTDDVMLAIASLL